jgi:hypothetical protein
MNRIKYLLLSLGIIAGFGLAILPVTASAVSVNMFDACKTNTGNPICADAQSGVKINTFVGTIVNTLLYVLGAVAVFVIILSGISYVTSTGDPAAITKAKSTLTYAVIGLVVSLLAYAIVNYVIGIVK